MKYYLIFLLSLIGSFQVHSGTADLELSMHINGIANGVQNGQQGTYTLTITNNGPEIAAAGITGDIIAAISSPIPLVEGGPAIDFLPSNSDDPRCGFAVAQSEPSPIHPSRFAYFIRVPSLQVNESIECSGLYIVNLAFGELLVNWSLNNQFDTDPDENNNEVTFLFGIAPRQVPATHFLGIVVLIMLTLLLVRNKKLMH